jgi:hypothetical protein
MATVVFIEILCILIVHKLTTSYRWREDAYNKSMV